jgi:hypothetical protein
MATVNREGLEKLTTRKQDETAPALRSGVEYGPPIELLANKARGLGAYDLNGMVGRFDPERITMKQRSQMRRDPMIALGLHFRKTTLINAPWHIECEDPQIAAFVENALRAVYNRTLGQMMLALDFGYIPIVKRFQRLVPGWTYESDGETKDVWTEKNIPAVVWNTFQVLPPDGASVKFTEDGRSFNGFEHPLLPRSKDAVQPVRVPASHALWVTFNFDETFGDWYGYPITGHAFRYWWSYWYQWLLADRHMEQDADPPLKVSYPPGQSPDPDSPGTLVDNYIVALRAGQQLRDGATVAVPSDFYEIDVTGNLARGAKKWDMDFVKGGENIKAFHDSFEYLDVAKLRAIMVPDQALIGAKGSLSGNVAEAYGHAFTESQAYLMEWVDQIINDYMIPDLVEQNFIDAPPCRKVTDGFRNQDVEISGKLLEIIASNDPKALHLDYRKMVGDKNLPLLSLEDVEKAKEEAKAEQEAMLAEGDPLGGAPDLSEGRDNEARKRTKVADATDNT